MSHTFNIGSRTRPTSSRPTSQRGKQGRGITKKFTQTRTCKNNYSQQLQNCNIAECSFENPRVKNHEIYENIRPNFPNNRGHRMPERGGHTFRNYNPETTGTFIRSHSETTNFKSINERTENSFLPKEAVMSNNDSSRLPKHAQNPIFVGELMQRFNSIMPTSSLLSNEPQQQIQRKKITSLSDQNNKTLENSPQSFASISNNVSHGFRNNHSRSSNKPSSQPSYQEINRNNKCNYSSNNAKTCSGTVYDNTATKDRSFNTGNYIKRSQLADIFDPRFDHSILPNEHVSKTIESSTTSSDSTSLTKSLTSLNQQTTGINKDKLNQGLNLSKLIKDKTKHKEHQTRSADNNVKMPLQKMAENLSGHAIKHSTHDQKQKVPTKKKLSIETSKVKNDTDIERRNQILLAHGFKGKNNGNVISSEKHTMNSRETSLGESLFSQIKEFNLNDNESFKHKGDVDKSLSKTKTRIPSRGEQSIQQQLDLQKQIENFNNFLISQNTSEKKPPKPGYIVPITKENPSSTAFSTYERQGLTDGIFAGRSHFSINQSLASPNQRVPTRSEALQRFEEEYTIKRLEHEAKEREKEAIKREKYLAKYKHVDQGHRLDDGYLDEAVGFDPGFALIESEEDVRKRQQEQLWQDALIFQQVEKEKNDQRKKNEEEMKKQRLNKQLQNMDTGYVLGVSNNPDFTGNSQISLKISSPTHQAEAKSLDNLIQNNAAVEIQPKELENYDKKSIKFQLQSKFENLMSKPLKSSENKITATTKPAEAIPANCDLRGSSQDFTGNSQIFLKQSSPTHQAEAKSLDNLIQNNATVAKRPKQLDENDDKESIKLQLQTKFENLMSKPTKSSENEIISTTKPTNANPASCVLRNSSQGADGLLVLRPTEKTLHQALGNKLEVIDQMDKHGDSALYKPQIHPAPLYANNRFQCEHVADIGKATGAIHKLEPQVQVVHPSDRGLTSSTSSQNSSVSNQKTDKDVPSIDYQAEMRTARLRMQQKYEESLMIRQESGHH